MFSFRRFFLKIFSDFSKALGLLVLAFFLVPLIALAAKIRLNVPIPTPQGLLEEVSSFSEYLVFFYKFAISTVGIFAFVMIVLGGYMWLTAAGNAEQISKAKDTIYSAIFGLVLALLSYTLLYTINPQFVNFSKGIVSLPSIEFPTAEDLGLKEKADFSVSYNPTSFSPNNGYISVKIFFVSNIQNSEKFSADIIISKDDNCDFYEIDRGEYPSYLTFSCAEVNWSAPNIQIDVENNSIEFLTDEFNLAMNISPDKDYFCNNGGNHLKVKRPLGVKIYYDNLLVKEYSSDQNIDIEYNCS